MTVRTLHLKKINSHLKKVSSKATSRTPARSSTLPKKEKKARLSKAEKKEIECPCLDDLDAFDLLDLALKKPELLTDKKALH